MSKTFMRFVRDESGATAIEYALIASTLAIVLFGALAAIRPALSGAYTTIASAFP